MTNFYAYRHSAIINGVETPFYIGIGHKPVDNNFKSFRSEYKRAFRYSNRNILWNQIYNSVNRNIQIDILFECSSKKEIDDKEKEFIKLYGRIDLNTGPLVNRNSGGVGSSGRFYSEEERKRISILHTGKKHSEESKKKMSLVQKGHTWNKGCKKPESYKQKLSLRWKGRLVSDECKERIGNLFKGKSIPDQIKKKISLTLKGRKFTEDHKKKIAASLIGKPHSQERKNKIKASWIIRKQKI